MTTYEDKIIDYIDYGTEDSTGRHDMFLADIHSVIHKMVSKPSAHV